MAPDKSDGRLGKSDRESRHDWPLMTRAHFTEAIVNLSMNAPQSPMQTSREGAEDEVGGNSGEVGEGEDGAKAAQKGEHKGDDGSDALTVRLTCLYYCSAPGDLLLYLGLILLMFLSFQSHSMLCNGAHCTLENYLLNILHYCCVWW